MAAKAAITRVRDGANSFSWFMRGFPWRTPGRRRKRKKPAGSTAGSERVLFLSRSRYPPAPLSALGYANPPGQHASPNRVQGIMRLQDCRFRKHRAEMVNEVATCVNVRIR